MGDAKDILGLPKKAPSGTPGGVGVGGAGVPGSVGKGKKRERDGGGRAIPEGISREVYALTGGLPPIMPTFDPMLLLKKRTTPTHKVTWQWKPIVSSARPDDLKIYHWIKVMDGKIPTEDYSFAKYNKPPQVLQYTDEEYRSLLYHPRWTREETDALMEICVEIGPRFIVVADRYNTDVERYNSQIDQLSVPTAAAAAGASPTTGAAAVGKTSEQERAAARGGGDAAAAAAAAAAGGCKEEPVTGTGEVKEEPREIAAEAAGAAATAGAAGDAAGGSPAAAASVGPRETGAAAAATTGGGGPLALKRKERSVEEIKERYYDVTKKLLASRAAAGEEVPMGLLPKDGYNMRAEVERKTLLAAQLALTRRQLAEEEKVLAEAERILKARGWTEEQLKEHKERLQSKEREREEREEREREEREERDRERRERERGEREREREREREEREREVEVRRRQAKQQTVKLASIPPSPTLTSRAPPAAAVTPLQDAHVATPAVPVSASTSAAAHADVVPAHVPERTRPHAVSAGGGGSRGALAAPMSAQAGNTRMAGNARMVG
ncbi:hypothetical protein CLOM_g1508 [Closterium sp. NIES-68]|nr:hypothetical protein CLOM_g1508 [Closterium sp. NIES-68]